MNKQELEKRLVEANIPKDAYSLEGGLPNEAFCLGKSGDKWEVYYSERGQKTGLKTFESEEEACDYFINMLMSSFKRMGLL